MIFGSRSAAICTQRHLMRQLHTSFYCFVLCWFFLGLGKAHAAQVDVSHWVDAGQVSQTALSLSPYIAILEDPGLKLTLADVQRQDVATRFKSDFASVAALNFGYSKSAYWLRVAVRNTANTPVERLLEINSPPLGLVDLHQPLPDGTYGTFATGMTRPFATRPYANRNFVFPVSLRAGAEHIIYMRIQSTNPTIIPLKLWTPAAFHRYERDDYAVQAWYFGMAATMILFNLLLFVGLRDLTYLLYINFVTCFALSMAAQNGLGKEYLWPDSSQWSNIAATALYSLAALALGMFMRRMINTRRVIPKIDLFLQLFMLVVLLSPIGFYLNYPVFIRFAALMFAAFALTILATSILCAFKRQRSALFFVAAYAVLLLCVVITALRNSGLLPVNLLTQNALQLGSAIEMLVLAFALADRFDVMRQERVKAQQEKLEAQNSLVDSLRASERLLENRVAQRTTELQHLNYQLEALSATDSLTGLANRRHIDAVISSEWTRASRSGQTLALAMLDVDWFKRYNDHYGHLAGDECLRQVAADLKTTICRTTDTVGRYGGEEFILVLPNTDGAGALLMADRVCSRMQALALPHAVSEFGCVTVSVGVAAMIPNDETGPDTLIKQADEALYQAKERGRNQAVLAPQ